MLKIKSTNKFSWKTYYLYYKDKQVCHVGIDNDPNAPKIYGAFGLRVFCKELSKPIPTISVMTDGVVESSVRKVVDRFYTFLGVV